MTNIRRAERIEKASVVSIISTRHVSEIKAKYQNNADIRSVNNMPFIFK
jgi:hypothetical protein